MLEFEMTLRILMYAYVHSILYHAIGETMLIEILFLESIVKHTERRQRPGQVQEE